jgi:hypothetical protein
MSERKSDEDIRKYLPDLATILREADPARAREKRREAAVSVDLDAAMAERKHDLPEGDDPLYYTVNRAGRAPASPPGAADVSACRALARPLPSPLPVVRVVPVPRPAARAWPRWLSAALAIFAVIGPVAVAILLMTRHQGLALPAEGGALTNASGFSPASPPGSPPSGAVSPALGPGASLPSTSGGASPPPSEGPSSPPDGGPRVPLLSPSRPRLRPSPSTSPPTSPTPTAAPAAPPSDAPELLQ